MTFAPPPARLHPNNPHQGRYDLDALVAALPELAAYVIQTPKGDASVDFGNAQAVLMLNRALLKHHYHVEHWSLPKGFLCPPIPGRADYLHHVAELLAPRLANTRSIRALDIGTGANLIYPIIATQALGWHMVGSDINPRALEHAHSLIAANPNLTHIELRLQSKPQHLFTHIIEPDERFDLTLCNPPFFKSAAEANKQAARKWRNLKGAKAHTARNFGGQQQELWCDGGELAFLRRMVEESVLYANQVGWFTSLVSNQDHVPILNQCLQRAGAREQRTIAMSQGQKRSHVLAWRFSE